MILDFSETYSVDRTDFPITRCLICFQRLEWTSINCLACPTVSPYSHFQISFATNHVFHIRCKGYSIYRNASNDERKLRYYDTENPREAFMTTSGWELQLDGLISRLDKLLLLQ